MYRFFVEKDRINHSMFYLDKDYNHIRNVLRLKVSDKILLSDGENKEYVCEILEYDDELKRVLLRIVDINANSRELPTKITLFQGYPKGDKMETIIQKSVELGAFEVVPVSMKRSVVKLDEKRAAKKIERMNAIALSAAKQSKRGIVPKVQNVMTMNQALEYAGDMDYLIVPYELEEGMDYSRQVLKNATGKKHIGVFIGPEGGFDPEEIAMLEQNGGYKISLGHRILRTETAGMTVLSLLMFMLEEE